MEIEKDYTDILQEAVTEIKSARATVARQVNTAVIGVYWSLGKLLSERKIEKGYGAGVVKRLSVDLKNEFPDMGLSPRNLWNMKRFFERYAKADPKLQRCVAVLPWRHNLLLVEKVTDDKEAFFYAQKSLENGWTRDLLLNHLKANTYQHEKQLNPSHNFNQSLPAPIAEQATQLLKNKYNLGFLGLTESVKETELEQRLIEKIKHLYWRQRLYLHR